MLSFRHIGDVVCAIVEWTDRSLVAQCPEGKSLAGKWEFPGGKVEDGETPEHALHRELSEELGVTVRIAYGLTPVFHRYDDVSLRLFPFVCSLESGEPTLREHRSLAWIKLSMVGNYGFLEADLPVLDEYRKLRSGVS